MFNPADYPAERAAKAAYTRPNSSIPWERRYSGRTYWRTLAKRVIAAAFDRTEVADLLDLHREVARSRAPMDAWHCYGCLADLGVHETSRAVELASIRHRADVIRAWLLTGLPERPRPGRRTDEGEAR